MNELNPKEIVHRAGEDEHVETRKLTRSEMKKIVEIEATPMSKEDKKKIKDFNETMSSLLMISKYVVVLNYTTASVKFYKLNKVEDVETWLKDHTDYNESNCYYMTSPKPFEIKIDDVVN